MNARELRGKSDEDLQKELIDMYREVFSLRMQKGMGQLSRPSRIRNVRRDLARLKTVLSERGIRK